MGQHIGASNRQDSKGIVRDIIFVILGALEASHFRENRIKVAMLLSSSVTRNNITNNGMLLGFRMQREDQISNARGSLRSKGVTQAVVSDDRLFDEHSQGCNVRGDERLNAGSDRELDTIMNLAIRIVAAVKQVKRCRVNGLTAPATYDKVYCAPASSPWLEADPQQK